MPEISHQQAAALAVLEWLFSDEEEDRRSGRSFILALAYLRWAVARADGNSSWRDWVPVEDHFLGPAPNRDQIVLNYVEEIARSAGIIVETDRHRFRLVSADAGHWIFARRFLEEQFPETDVRVGLTEEQLNRVLQMRVGVPRTAPVRRRRNSAEPTLRERIVTYVLEHPGQTATQIASALKHGNDAVASTLLKEVREGTLERRPGEGPRGGFTYYLVEPVVGPSVWERVKTNPFAGVESAHGDDAGNRGGADDPDEV